MPSHHCIFWLCSSLWTSCLRVLLNEYFQPICFSPLAGTESSIKVMNPATPASERELNSHWHINREKWNIWGLKTRTWSHQRIIWLSRCLEHSRALMDQSPPAQHPFCPHYSTAASAGGKGGDQRGQGGESWSQRPSSLVWAKSSLPKAEEPVWPEQLLHGPRSLKMPKPSVERCKSSTKHEPSPTSSLPSPHLPAPGCLPVLPFLLKPWAAQICLISPALVALPWTACEPWQGINPWNPRLCLAQQGCPRALGVPGTEGQHGAPQGGMFSSVSSLGLPHKW